MKRLVILTTLLAILSILIGCSSQPSTEPSSKPTGAAEQAEDEATAAEQAEDEATESGSDATETADSTSPEEEAYNPQIDPADFVDVVDNPYYPRIAGSKYVYEGETEEGLERIEVEILSETREVMGITATVMRDTVYLDGELIEDTFDWFAQDKEGNVWYLGEEVDNYENGEVYDHAGSWEAGVDGALPGIVMYGDPATHIGETYLNEYYKGEAEDTTDLLSVSESVTVPYGSFDNVVQTKDYTPLEPDLLEHKFFAEGIGEIKAVDLNTGEEFVLVEVTKP